jgi:hypothetical protein
VSARSDAPVTTAGATVTVSIPLSAIGPLTVVAPAPVLVSSTTGASYVGCTQAELIEHLRWMAAQPRWREQVIVASAKRRFASPLDVVESMRERYAAPSLLARTASSSGVDGSVIEADRQPATPPRLRPRRRERVATEPTLSASTKAGRSAAAIGSTPVARLPIVSEPTAAPTRANSTPASPDAIADHHSTSEDPT